MVRFFGNTVGKVDDKGRVVLPAIYRDALSRGGLTNEPLIIKKSLQDRCLNLFTEEEWARRSDKALEGIDPELSAEHAAFWRSFNDGVYYVVPDEKLGRLNIPSELLTYAGITKEAEFAGVGYKIEIWAREARENALLTADQFKTAAESLSAKK